MRKALLRILSDPIKLAMLIKVAVLSISLIGILGDELPSDDIA